jgi:hypothetical protein
VSARDDLAAILAVTRVTAYSSNHPNPMLGIPRAKSIIDAIPNDELVRLAIERGVLVQADVWDSPDYHKRVGVYYEDERIPPDAIPLYRVVEP